jgi:anti-sigma B factor antagonist
MSSETSAAPATSVDRRGDVVIVKVEAKNLDEDNTRRVHADIAAALEQSPRALPFVLDLSNVKFLPSLTLGAMVRLGNEFRSRNQRLILTALQPTIRQVVIITRLDRVFEIHDSVDDALKAIRG